MQEIRDKLFDYAGKVKAIDPNALVLGPEEWGWPGYLYSGYDLAMGRRERRLQPGALSRPRHERRRWITRPGCSIKRGNMN